jgi:hypothetical protein
MIIRYCIDDVMDGVLGRGAGAHHRASCSCGTRTYARSAALPTGRDAYSLEGRQVMITDDGASTQSVSIMEFAGDLVTHKTQCFADPFPAAARRAALAEPIPARDR